MTLVLVGKGIVLGDWPSKVELIGAPGIYTLYSFINANMISMISHNVYIYIFLAYSWWHILQTRDKQHLKYLSTLGRPSSL